MDEVVIRGLQSFDIDFPEIVVGSRATRNQDAKDWWSARRALLALLAGTISGEARLRRIPGTSICRSPDFEFCSSLGFGFLEVTEATHPDDQKEMSASERIEGGHLLGSHGGRGGNQGFVGNTPERMTAADVEEAISRKHQHYSRSLASLTTLAIYVNSNPGFLVSNIRDLHPYLGAATQLASDFAAVVIFRDSGDALMLHARSKEVSE